MSQPGIKQLGRVKGGLVSPSIILTTDPATPAPAEPVRRKRKTRRKPQPQYLQTREIEALMKVIHSARDRAIFSVTYHAGLRASEVGLLNIRDWNPKTERLFVHRLKNSNSGEHPLSREEAKCLRAWLKVRGDGPGCIFPSRKQNPISRQQLDKLMKKYGKLAGIPPNLRHFHTLKHSCATHLFSKGFHVEQVQDWIGHVNIQNTIIYAKITNPRRDEMAEKLRDAW